MEILFRVYKDTSDLHFELPPGVNLHDVAERLLFLEKGIPSLNQLYLELVNQDTQSPHFAQALDYVLHLGGM